MPASLLFDLDPIDLDAVALPSEEIERLNPQRGDMRHLDHVIWVSDDRIRALGVKHVREDEFWVPGHIPGRPLLPGVIMIESAAQIASVLYRLQQEGDFRFVGFTRCDNVVFRGQVVPGQRLHLLARVISSTPRRFICETQAVVDGGLVFEAKITGMAM